MAQLGFMLTRSPYASSGSRSFYLLAKSALDKGHKVRAFFCFDGVYQCLKDQKAVVTQDKAPDYWLDTLVFAGAELVASHGCLDTRGLTLDDLYPGVRMGTLDEFATLVDGSDRMVCL